MKRITVFSILLLSIGSSISHAQHIHVLMFADTNDARIGDGVLVTVDNMKRTFERLVPTNQYSFTVLSTKHRDYRDRDVFQAINRIRVDPNDTFVYLHDGHGGNSRGKHFLSMPNNGRAIWSSQLRELISRKPCKLKLIITDSCNVVIDVVMNRRRIPTSVTTLAWDPEEQGIAPVMKALFQNHRGLLHWNSSRTGEMSFTNGATGSYFFNHLFDYLQHNLQANPSWKDVDRFMDKSLATTFEERFGGRYTSGGYTSTSWATVYWSMPEPISSSGKIGISRLGVTARNCKSRGVHVDSVDRNSLATRLTDVETNERISLESGDHIVTVNGVDVESASQLSSLLQKGQSELRLLVRDKRTGHLRQLTANERTPDDEPRQEQIVLRPGMDRLGIRCHTCADGVHVDAVSQNSPATHMWQGNRGGSYLEPGDHIISMHGRNLRTTEDYHRVLNNAPNVVFIHVRNKNDGKIYRFKVRLD